MIAPRTFACWKLQWTMRPIVTRVSVLLLLTLTGCFGWPQAPETWRHPTKDSLEQAADLRACENLAALKYAQVSSTVDYPDFRQTSVRPCMISRGYTLD